MEVKLTNVFHRTGQALINAVNGTGPKLIINQGGQGSSKTFSTLQVIYNYLKYKKQPIEATLCSYALPHLKAGVCGPFDKILTSFGENVGKVKSNPQAPIYNIGKSLITTYGIEGNLAFAHGPRRDLLYINEVNRKVSYEVFDQLFSRSGVTLIDFNPDQSFWLHDRVLSNFPHVLIKSNYLDNPFLPESELRNILMKKNNPVFANWWKVYGLGELGTLEGCVLTNWRYETSGEIDEAFNYLPTAYGLDYGFHPDPDAMTKSAIDVRRKKIFVKELIYSNYNGTTELVNRIRQFYKSDELIVAESASPRTNEDLSRHFNLRPVSKTKTKGEWLREMQDYEIIISETSYNLAKELQNYIWNDKKAGIPIDAFDHLIDSIRYRFMEQMQSTSKILIIQEV